MTNTPLTKAYQMAKQVLHPTKIKIVLKPVRNQVEEVLQSMEENL